MSEYQTKINNHVLDALKSTSSKLKKLEKTLNLLSTRVSVLSKRVERLEIKK